MSSNIIGLVENIADKASHAELCLNALNVGTERIHAPYLAEINGGPETELIYNPVAIGGASKFVDPMRDQARMCINESSARADFNWLDGQHDFNKNRFHNFSTYLPFGGKDDHLTSDNLMNEEVWNNRSLYSLGFISEHGKRTIVLDCTNALLNRLILLDLKFLSDDLRYLWRGYKLGEHASRYLTEFSTSEMQNARSLNRLILEDIETDHMQAVRILLLGPGGAGKSSLADLLQGKTTEHPRYATMGIDFIDSSALDFKNSFPELLLEYKNLELYLWDFGGQVILHGLHSTLFHENCIYVLVVDSRHEQVPDDWLYQIQHLAGFQAKVLVVTNIYENCLRKQNENRLIKQFPSLLSPDSFFYFSCIDPNDRSFERFINKLIEASQNKQRQLLADTLRINSIVEETYQHETFINIDGLESIIDEHNNSEESVDYLIEKLLQLGFLIPIDSDKTVYCLKPYWLIDNAYRLINSSLINEANGLASMKELRNEFNSDISLGDLKNLISFLQEKGLCQKLENSDEQYFFPESANSNEPFDLIGQSQLDKSLTFRFDLQYMPLGYHKELVNGLFRVSEEIGIENNKDIWKEGLIYKSEKSQAQVQYFLRKSIIEVVLSGEIGGFADLLDVFYKILIKLIVNSSGTSEKIYVSLRDKNGIISDQSCEELVHFLSGIDNFKELHKKVREMSGKKVINKFKTTVTGDSVNVANNSENSTLTSNTDKRVVEINDSQYTQLKDIIDAILLKRSDLSSSELSSIENLNQTLNNTGEDNKALTVWNALDQSIGFVSNTTQIAGYVQENWAPILAVITAVMNNIPLS